MSTLNQDIEPGTNITWVPDLLYVNGRFERDRALVCDAGGRIVALNALNENEGPQADARVIRLPGRAMLPGMVNAHSHAFQRVIRGRTEHRSRRRAAADSFWTWREMMYRAASRLMPEDLYDASRMAFLEMALSGITSVGEFHYLHRTPEGREYDEPNLLAKAVVRAARDVGLRIALLRVAYARAGFQKPPDERQRRFIEADAETYMRNTEMLASDLMREEDSAGDEAAFAWVGVAPHSVRAVPLETLREVSAFADERNFPVHMHVAEQPAEVSACLEETGKTPVALLAEHGILNSRFTGIHAVHVTSEEIDALASSGAGVCACPTTERNLGDGIVPADEMLTRGVPLALGTDSHTQIDLLEDARELEYHLRLQRLERNVLAPQGETTGAGENAAQTGEHGGELSTLAARLFECATISGAQSIGAPAGEFAPGRAADFFTVDTEDPSIAGASAQDLLPAIVFSLARTALREVAVGGRLVVEEGRHRAQEETVERFAALQRKLWA